MPPVIAVIVGPAAARAVFMVGARAVDHMVVGSALPRVVFGVVGSAAARVVFVVVGSTARRAHVGQRAVAAHTHRHALDRVAHRRGQRAPLGVEAHGRDPPRARAEKPPRPVSHDLDVRRLGLHHEEPRRGALRARDARAVGLVAARDPSVDGLSARGHHGRRRLGEGRRAAQRDAQHREQDEADQARHAPGC